MSDIDQRAEKIFSFYNMSARKQHVAFCNACVFFEPGERNGGNIVEGHCNTTGCHYLKGSHKLPSKFLRIDHDMVLKEATRSVRVGYLAKNK